MKFTTRDENTIFFIINIGLCGVALVLADIFQLPRALSLLLMAFFILISYRVQLYFRKKAINRLIEEVQRLLHDDENTVLDNSVEGELAVLYDDIRKMSIKLRESYNRTNQDKVYLLDSMADISHQLRTPLTTVNIQLDMLLKEEDNFKRKRYIGSIKSQLQRVEWLIASLLKISKMDAKAVTMNLEKQNLSYMIGKAAESSLVIMEVKDQHFEYVSQGNIVVNVDYHWFLEALSNIIKNSVEHTPEGGVIRVTAKQNNIYTQIVIEDNGKGISKEDLPHLFERFYRGKDSDDSSIGIGLALSNMIIKNHNGSIKAENGKNGGSRFTIKLYDGDFYGSSKS